MQKIFLINPYFQPFEKEPQMESLGLLYIASAIKDICEIILLDTMHNQSSSENVANIICKINPEYVGISLKFSACWTYSKEIVQKSRINGYKGVFIFGGNGATFLYKRLLEGRIADFVVMHEGEVTIRDLIQYLNAYSKGKSTYNERFDIKGISYLHDDRVIQNTNRSYIKNLDDISFPAREYYKDYFSKTNTAYICTTRGCTYSCFYCSTSKFWGDIWRSRSASNIIDEILSIRKMFPNVSDFKFTDDNFMINRKFVKEFIKLAKENFNDSCTYNFSTRPELIDEEILYDLKTIGTKHIFIGLESGSPRILNNLKRRYSPNEVIKTISYAESIGINLHASFMIGIPGETKEDMDLTLALMENINASYIQCHIFTPFPGTPCFEEPDKYGILLVKNTPEEFGLDRGIYFSSESYDKSDLTKYYLKALAIIRRKSIRMHIQKKV